MHVNCISMAQRPSWYRCEWTWSGAIGALACTYGEMNFLSRYFIDTNIQLAGRAVTYSNHDNLTPSPPSYPVKSSCCTFPDLMAKAPPFSSRTPPTLHLSHPPRILTNASDRYPNANISSHIHHILKSFRPAGKIATTPTAVRGLRETHTHPSTSTNLRTISQPTSSLETRKKRVCHVPQPSFSVRTADVHQIRQLRTLPSMQILHTSYYSDCKLLVAPCLALPADAAPALLHMCRRVSVKMDYDHLSCHASEKCKHGNNPPEPSHPNLHFAPAL